MARTSTTRALIRSDVASLRRRMGSVPALVYPNLLAVALYRVSRRLHISGHRRIARVVMWLNQLLTGAELEPTAEVGEGFVLAHTSGVLVGRGARAGRGLFLHGGVVLGSIAHGQRYGFPRLGDDVTVYAKASVLGDVLVGDGAVIGAHALVLEDVGAGLVARGVPAKAYAVADS